MPTFVDGESGAHDPPEGLPERAETILPGFLRARDLSSRSLLGAARPCAFARRGGRQGGARKRNALDLASNRQGRESGVRKARQGPARAVPREGAQNAARGSECARLRALEHATTLVEAAQEGAACEARRGIFLPVVQRLEARCLAHSNRNFGVSRSRDAKNVAAQQGLAAPSTDRSIRSSGTSRPLKERGPASGAPRQIAFYPTSESTNRQRGTARARQAVRI